MDGYFNQLQGVLSPAEQITIKLGKLFCDSGYSRYRMDRFEPYDLYRENQSFLAGDGIITFTGAGGRLMALKPDVTIGIIKNTDPAAVVSKLFYNEKVFRTSGPDRELREIGQTGLEYIGADNAAAEAEVVRLAADSLDAVDSRRMLCIGHMGLVCAILDEYGVLGSARSALLDALTKKSRVEIDSVCNQYGLGEGAAVAIKKLTGIRGPLRSAVCQAEGLGKSEGFACAYGELSELAALVGNDEGIILDLSAVNDADYYNGIILKGFVGGSPSAVLAGGRYDKLMRRFGKPQRAMGFALYLGEAERAMAAPMPAGDGDFLTVALPKGRLGDSVYELLSGLGYECPDINAGDRKLVFENPVKKIRYLLVKPSDVAIYVEHGASDIGVAGRDVIMESQPDVYELADLGIGKCRFAVAARNGYKPTGGVVRVATKYPRVSQAYFAKTDRRIEIIKLHGSIELAPLLGLSDVILDIVETGKTLAENNLAIVEEVAQSSALLIANKSSYAFKRERIDEIRRAASERKQK